MSILETFQNVSRRGLGLDGLHFVLREDYGSQSADHRARIREDIFRRIRLGGPQLSHEAEEKLGDLNHPPQAPGQLISISHCRNLGGYAWLAQTGRLGFDVEELTRLKVATVQRVSTPSEFALLPEPATLLWVAKEAAFKALAPLVGLNTISQISIDHWQNLGGDNWLFQADFAASSTPLQLQGVAGTADGFAAAVVYSPVTRSD